MHIIKKEKKNSTAISERGPLRVRRPADGRGPARGSGQLRCFQRASRRYSFKERDGLPDATEAQLKLLRTEPLHKTALPIKDHDFRLYQFRFNPDNVIRLFGRPWASRLLGETCRGSGKIENTYRKHYSG